VDSRRMRRRRRSVASESAGSVLGLGSDSSEEGLGRKWLTSGGRFFTKNTAGLASVVRSTSVGLRHAITRVAREERLHWIRCPASNCSTSQKNFLYMYSVQHSRFTRVLHSFPLYSSCWASRNRRCSQVSVVSLSPRLVTGANQWPPVLSHRHLPLHASKAPTTVPAVAAQCPEPSHLSTLRFAATAFLHPDPETRGSSAMEVLHLLLLLPLPQPLDLRNFGARPVS
jgi:hypothetical protein